MKIEFTQAAIRDLQSLRQHIRGDDPMAARRVGERILQAVDIISKNLGIGRLIDRDDVREWSIPGLPYVIPYHASKDKLEILRVFHVRRRRPDHWL
ncbi:type II toxin-antitoxin system RelE/ParE family toxin [Georhizobium sp. MAB10]|uniref:type II toxin-antitoxin system RelE/ParE family toxin n=1 Tax=Georhizobium sp. MAB10 TaxID=3028319 RepID=UPI003855CAED